MTAAEVGATFGERAADNWAVVAVACLVGGLMVGWEMRKRWARVAVQARPVLNTATGKVVAWRAYIGRLAISDRTDQAGAERHADVVRREL